VPYFDGAVGRVYFRAWRAPAPGSAAVVFLHGFGEHSGLYHRLGGALTAAGIDLWALDEIGHGLSDGPRAVIESIDDLVQNGRRLTALAGAAEPGRPIFLAGHSLGAAAAAVSAARDPSAYRGLILSGAPLSPLDWVTDLSADGAGAALSLDPADLSADPFYLDELENDPLAFTGAEGAGALLSTLPPAWAELSASFGRIGLPVLFVHGAQDPIVPAAVARDWSARVPGGRLAEFAGARHDVLNDTVHHEVAAAITEFIRSLAGPAEPRPGGDRPARATGSISPGQLAAPAGGDSRR
jgi:alpha-beta hydrolase superfamily lysophospholipase